MYSQKRTKFLFFYFMFVLLKQKMVGKQSFIDIYKNTKTKKVNCFHFFAGTMVFDSSVYFSTWVLGLSGFEFWKSGFYLFPKWCFKFLSIEKKKLSYFYITQHISKIGA